MTRAKATRSQRAPEAKQVLNSGSPPRQEELFRAVVHGAMDGFWIIDEGGRILEVNTAYCHLIGYSRSELLGMSIPDIEAAESLEDTNRHIEAVRAAGADRFVTKHRRKDGELIDVEVSVQYLPERKLFYVFVRDVSNLVREVQAQRALDVTERRRAEEAARESMRLLTESQRVARLGSYHLDVLAGVWTSSPVLDEIFGITDSEFRRDVPAWLSIVHPDDRARMAVYLTDEVLGRRQRFDREYRIVRLNDGQTRWVHGLGELVHDQTGQPVEMIGTIQDITDRKQLETQFNQAQKMESVGRLAGGVAHDFNNLLTVILGETELALRDMRAGDARRPSLEGVLTAGRRAADLTRQLLAFSRQQPVEPSTFDMNALIADVDRMLRRLIGENIALVCEATASPGTVNADRGQIEQVLMNLVVNAKDAMPNGGSLEIRTANVTVTDGQSPGNVPMKPGEYVLLAVTDTGVGMSEEAQVHAFEPFFTTKERDQGTGLGLATCYGIVKQTGGYVVAHSELGRGTAMSVYLPLSRSQVTKSGGREKAAAVGGAETILLVEDEITVRAIATRVLESQGYRVLRAGSGEEALGLLDSYADHIHLVLTDVMLPGMNGRAMAERVQARRPGIKVLYMSGYAGDMHLRQVLSEQSVTLLHKPFTVAQLGSKVRESLDAIAPGMS